MPRMKQYASDAERIAAFRARRKAEELEAERQAHARARLEATERYNRQTAALRFAVEVLTSHQPAATAPNGQKFGDEYENIIQQLKYRLNAAYRA